MKRNNQTTYPQISQDPSPDSPNSSRPSLQQAIWSSYARLLVLLGFFAVFTTGFYLVVYFATGIRQTLWAAIPIFTASLLIPLIIILVRRGAIFQAGIITLVGASVAYGVNELLWTGLTPYHVVGGILLILLAGLLVLPREQQIWLSAIGIYLVYIIFAYFIHPLPRVSIKDLPILVPYAIGVNVTLVLTLGALLIRSLRTRTIRLRLLINFIMLVLTPVILSAVISSVLSAQNARNRVYAQLESVISLKDAEIKAWIANLEGSLQLAMPVTEQRWIFSSSLELANFTSLEPRLSPTAADIENSLRRLVIQTRAFDEIFLLNAQGKVFVSTNPSILNFDQSGEQYFVDGLIKPRISTVENAFKSPGETQSASAVKSYSVILSVPVLDQNGDTIGVLAGKASPAVLNEIMLERTGLGKTGETYLVNSQVVLITGSRFEGYTIGKQYRFSKLIQTALLKQTNGKGTYQNYSGVTVLGAYRWQPVLQLLMIAENSQSEALQSTYQTLGINVGVVVVAALFALVAGWYAARGITDPLANLSKTAEAIAAGKSSLRAEIEQEDEVGALARSFNSMTDQMRLLLDGMERRITDRTQELERRSVQLQVAAEVARDATSTRDLTELLNRAVNLVIKNFGFYHAGIFLIDERKEYAVLRAATGEAGSRMIAAGHKLAIGKNDTTKQHGLVGFVSSSGQARIASDVGEDAVHFKNPYLPDTRSEVALPLKVGSQVIGVLDVQSVVEDAFTEENVKVLQTLADQLAIAIENARLFQEMSQTVRELETVYRQYTREAWTNLTSQVDETRGEPISDYRFRGLNVETADKPNVEAVEALETGNTVLKSETAQSALAIPLRLRGQTLGVLNLHFAGQDLPAEAVATYEEIANRLVLVMENARLLQEAQQLAKREQKINWISTQIRSSPTTDSILRNTVRELGNALRSSRTFIQLGVQVELPGNGSQGAAEVPAAGPDETSKEHRE